jgi:D-alanine-D-alanine ligase
MANYRVGVIIGGRSTEHEVSVVTGVQVMKFLSKRHTVVPIYITKEGAWLTGAKLANLETYKNLNLKDPELQPLVITPDRSLGAIQNPFPKGLLEKPKKVELDVVFPAMHGMNGEDGTLQGLLELADLPYVGAGVLASAICMDKVMTKVVLRGSGLPILDFIAFTRAEWEREEEAIVGRIEAKFGYPVIVKPARLGSSIGIEMAANPDDLRFHISVATHFDHKIIIEPYLKDRVDLNCSVMGNAELTASVCEQPVSHEALLTFADKYLQGQHAQGMEGAKRIVPAPISTEMTAEVQRLSKETFRAVDGRGIARIDFLLDRATQKLYINELNTLPGSFAFYLWEPVGVSPEELVDRLVHLAVEAHQEKAKTQFTSSNQLLQHADFLGLKKA